MRRIGQRCGLTAAALYRHFDSKEDITPTMAEGIAIGKTMRSEEILEYVYKYGVRFIHAREDEILDARAAQDLNPIIEQN